MHRVRRVAGVPLVLLTHVEEHGVPFEQRQRAGDIDPGHVRQLARGRNGHREAGSCRPVSTGKPADRHAAMPPWTLRTS